MDAHATKPQVLVADDDPVSLRFFTNALSELGCAPHAAANGAAALDASADTEFDLLLLDRRMPDCGGALLLRLLRERGIDAPALATSAELDATMRAELDGAGYAGALTKPITLDALAQTLALHLRDWRDPRVMASAPTPAIEAPGTNRADAIAVLDDAAGLACVGGDRATLHALRGLLAEELETLREQLAVTPNPNGFAETLHRLRASCRYCGASALGDAALRLETAIRGGTTDAQVLFSQFADACARAHTALTTEYS